MFLGLSGLLKRKQKREVTQQVQPQRKLAGAIIDIHEHIIVPAMMYPTFPANQFDRVINGWDYVRYSTLGLAAQRILRDNVPGAFAEAGVWKGHCASFMHMFAPERPLYLFDTFEGFPNSGESKGDRRFADTTVEEVLANVGEPTQSVFIRKGVFPETSKGLEDETFSLVSLDLDTYSGMLSAWKFFYPRTSRGGYIFVHDYNGHEYEDGTGRATREFLSDKIEQAIELSDQWGSALIRKS